MINMLFYSFHIFLFFNFYFSTVSCIIPLVYTISSLSSFCFIFNVYSRRVVFMSVSPADLVYRIEFLLIFIFTILYILYYCLIVMIYCSEQRNVYLYLVSVNYLLFLFYKYWLHSDNLSLNSSIWALSPIQYCHSTLLLFGLCYYLFLVYISLVTVNNTYWYYDSSHYSLFFSLFITSFSWICVFWALDIISLFPMHSWFIEFAILVTVRFIYYFYSTNSLFLLSSYYFKGFSRIVLSTLSYTPIIIIHQQCWTYSILMIYLISTWK